MMPKSIFVLLLLVVSLTASSAAIAQPKPGDVYRDYKWHPRSATGPARTPSWLRVTAPDATVAGARAFLPNSINHLNVNDFEHAIRAEMALEVLNVHTGTKGHKVRVNEGDWMPIPLSPLVPGNAGTGLPALEYHTMQYPTIPIALDTLKNGDNLFEFSAERGTSFARRWPQWISYGVSIRIYYDEAAKDHPTGQITSHSNGATIGENEVFSVDAAGSTPIQQVDFVGKYTDFNWKGDGDFRQWQDRTFYTKIRDHIGKAKEAPYNVTWDNDWIPDQDEPMEVSARILDTSGLTYITPAVTGLELDRPYSVKMYKAHDIPRHWGTRAGNSHSAKIKVTDDLSEATESQITLATWNGTAAKEVTINGDPILERFGYSHQLSYQSVPVPVDSLIQGDNVFKTFSTTTHHGIDVQWPGPVLFVREQVPEPSTLSLLGLGLASLRGRRRTK